MCHKLSVNDFLALSLFASAYGEVQLRIKAVTPTHRTLQTMVNQTLKPQQIGGNYHEIVLEYQNPPFSVTIDALEGIHLLQWVCSDRVTLMLTGCTCSFCERPRVQLDCSRVCVCECDRIVVNVSLDNSGLGWLTLCQE